MPNHVDQDLYLTGDVESLKSFLEFAKEDDEILSANKFIPYPDEYLIQDKIAAEKRLKGDYMARDGFNSGGYQWCLQNWGTKWGIYHARIEAQKLIGKKGRVKFTCQSAWSPPLPVIKAMSDKFPSLKFKLKYYEGGMGFKGIYIVEGGTVLEDSDAKYNGHRGG
jgi:hypothetical protein